MKTINKIILSVLLGIIVASFVTLIRNNKNTEDEYRDDSEDYEDFTTTTTNEEKKNSFVAPVLFITLSIIMYTIYLKMMMRTNQTIAIRERTPGSGAGTKSFDTQRKNNQRQQDKAKISDLETTIKENIANYKKQLQTINSSKKVDNQSYSKKSRVCNNN